MIDSVYHMGRQQSTAKEIELDPMDELIDHLGKILAEEYILLMQQEEKQDEGSNLCQILKRESETREY